MARKGALTKKTYFPSNGDVLEEQGGGAIWECVRTNGYISPSGEKMRYGLLIGKVPDMEASIPVTIHDQDGSPWLDGIGIIKRGEKTYVWNIDSGTWQEGA
jgi:hypothetical protein